MTGRFGRGALTSDVRKKLILMTSRNLVLDGRLIWQEPLYFEPGPCGFSAPAD